ncbi:PID-CTERM protein-sorting domain-containing protein [Pedobacter duraquae]|uniref:PID-CTERM protein-sorting domain-containing protein n=1 Tax=Pedobacter duraquae TaxID=425511 RepID=UPI0010600E4A|nr:hypothetical protein [Pedobacter duraquae]
MKKRKWIFRFLSVFVILAFPVFAVAQDCTPLDPSYPDCLDPDSPVPIDDGVILLLIVGVLFGFWYVRKQVANAAN